MASYSSDLRQRALAALRRGEPAKDVAARFEVHATTARAWRRLDAQGITTPRKVGAKPVCTKLTPDDLVFLRQSVEREPGITLLTLVDRLAERGTHVVESTVCRALKRLGLSFKKSRSSPASSSGRMWQPTASTSGAPGRSPRPTASSSSTRVAPTPT